MLSEREIMEGLLHLWTQTKDSKYLRAMLQLFPEPTAEQKREQAISFAYGNAKLSNPNVTREMVEKAFDDAHERS